MDVTIRTATDDDWPRMARADAAAFGFAFTQQDLDDRRPTIDLDRFLVAVEGDAVVGVTGDFPFDMTVPGGGSIGVPGVTWVSVMPTHRRRGILRALMDEQHRRFLDQASVLSILTASEGSIYGRFGYGPATLLRKTEVDRRHARLRDDLGESGPVRLVDVDEARRSLPGLHERWRARTPGAINRTGPWWDLILLDREGWRDGASPNFFAVHPDGYLRYRIRQQWNEGQPAHEVEVEDLFTATDGATVDLWRYLLGLDLVGPIRTWDSPPGDPLPLLLTNPRHAVVRTENDGVWLRVLDVESALAARRYGVEGSLVLDVADPFLELGGRFALDGGPDRAACAATGAGADLALTVGALGSMYLGAHRASTLAAAGLVEELTPGAVRRADAMFAADRPAHYGTGF